MQKHAGNTADFLRDGTSNRARNRLRKSALEKSCNRDQGAHSALLYKTRFAYECLQICRANVGLADTKTRPTGARPSTRHITAHLASIEPYCVDLSVQYWSHGGMSFHARTVRITHRPECPEVLLLGEKTFERVSRRRGAVLFRTWRGERQRLELPKVGVHLGFPLHRHRVQARAAQQLQLIVCGCGWG